MNTLEAAQNKWRGILMHIGISQDHLTGRHGPCPLCGGHDRFRWDDKEGKGTYFCSKCGAGTGMQLAMRYTESSFGEMAREIDKVIGNIPEHKRAPVVPLDRLKRIRAGLVPVTKGDPVYQYLRGRGLRVPVDHVKLHPSLPYWDQGEMLGKFPAMVSAVRDPEGRVKTLHQTYLAKDGHGKANVPSPKKVASSLPLGGAIRTSSSPSCEMGIAEGLETALACKELFGIDTWAAINATMLAKFEPPPECKKLHVYADADDSFTGQRYAFELAHKLRDKIDVEVHVPEFGDWADQLEIKNAG